MFRFVIVVMLAAGCAGFEKEIKLMESSISVMDKLSTVLAEEDRDNYLEALEEFEEQFTVLQPGLKKMIHEHPEWEKEAPEEVSEYMENLITSYEALMGRLWSLKKMLKMEKETGGLMEKTEASYDLMSSL